MVFELYKDRIGQFRWRLYSVNGRILADSGEGYSSKQAMLDAIDSIRKYVSISTIVDHTDQ